MDSSNTTSPPAAAILTREEAAGELRVNVRTIDRMLARGEIKGARVGRSVRIHRRELQRLLDGE